MGHEIIRLLKGINHSHSTAHRPSQQVETEQEQLAAADST